VNAIPVTVNGPPDGPLHHDGGEPVAGMSVGVLIVTGVSPE
jgi:hypothetical protein